MFCIKCTLEVPDGNFCIMCGARQARLVYRRARANGTGTAYKRGKTWTACVVIGWKPSKKDPNRLVPIKRTKGGFKTKRSALEYCPELKGQPTKHEHSDITFSELFPILIERHKGRAGRDTINCYKSAYKYYDSIYSYRMVDLSTADMQKCIDTCPHGKRTRQNMKTLASLMFTLAFELKVVTENYATPLWVPDLKQEKFNEFPTKVLNKILNAALKGDDAAALIACNCWLGGYRTSAFLSIKKTDYDPVEKTVIGGSKTDAGRDLVIPISPKIQPLIDRLMLNETKYLFTNTDRKYNDKTYRDKCFYPFLNKIGVQPVPAKGEKPKYSPYSCRVTFATMMKNVNGSEKDKAGLMGHSSFDMTLHYQREDLESKRNIINQL